MAKKSTGTTRNSRKIKDVKPESVAPVTDSGATIEPVNADVTAVNTEATPVELEVKEVDLTVTQNEPTNNDISAPPAPQADIETEAEVKPEEEAPKAKVEPEEEKEEEETESEMFLSPEDLADYAIQLLDLGHQGLLPKMYMATSFTKEERAKLREILSGELTVITPEVKDLKARFAVYEEYEKGLPLTPNERKSLRKNCVKYFKTLDIKMSPGWALFSSFAMVSGMRMIPIFGPLLTNIFEKFFANND